MAKESRVPRRSLTRRIGLVFATVVGLVLAVGATFQVLAVTFFVEPTETQFSCRQGTRQLYRSLQETLENLPRGAREESEILSEFRLSLAPIWKQAPSIRAKCQKRTDRDALRALRSIELLRYAEERAIRANALGLAKWRKQAPQLVAALGLASDNKDK